MKLAIILICLCFFLLVFFIVVILFSIAYGLAVLGELEEQERREAIDEWYPSENEKPSF